MIEVRLRADLIGYRIPCVKCPEYLSEEDLRGAILVDVDEEYGYVTIKLTNGVTHTVYSIDLD
jgi:hypothetical protein